MIDEELLETLRAEAENLNAVEMADLLERLNGGISQFSMTSCFKSAFPEIPLRELILASGWNRLSSGGLSDQDFNEMLSPWLPRRTPDQRPKT